MSKMTCMEAIFEVLAGRTTSGLDQDCFDDLVNGCYALATGASDAPDVPAWIAAQDKERSEEQICMDICDYFHRYHSAAKPSATLARAIAAGKGAL